MRTRRRDSSLFCCIELRESSAELLETIGNELLEGVGSEATSCFGRGLLWSSAHDRPLKTYPFFTAEDAAAALGAEYGLS